jgi:probable F420-dependent oxidoreductase
MPEIGLFLPTAAPDARSDTVVDFARRAEAAGLQSVWAIDRLVFDNAEALLSLAAAAAVTTRVRLGTGVLLGATRPPALLAKMGATLDFLSNGRFILGLGVGNRPDDFASVGVPFEQRGARVSETIALLRQTWRGEPVDHAGRHFALDVGAIGPRPVRPGGPPIWLGGASEAALRRAGRLADGFIASSSGTADDLRRTWATLDEQARAAGRDPASITRAALVWAAVDDDAALAHERASAYLRHYYPPARAAVPPMALVGTPAQCRERAVAFFDAGVQALLVGPTTADPAHLDRLLNDVLTRL